MLGIVNDGAIFLSDAAFLNDSSEIAYARSVVRQVLAQLANADEYVHVEALLQKAMGEFEPDGGIQTSQLRHYVASFCEAPDLLSQWRAYGKPGSGYALGFDSAGLINRGRSLNDEKWVELVRVIYDAEEQQQIVASLIAHWREGVPSDISDELVGLECYGALLLSLSLLLPQLKHPVFQEEREWRLATPLYGNAENDRLRFRENGLSITPYIVFDLKSSSGNNKGRLPLKRITHAPTSDPDYRKRALRELLRSKGYGDQEVVVTGSSIPLRSW